jgi:hypothetical protein
VRYVVAIGYAFVAHVAAVSLDCHVSLPARCEPFPHRHPCGDQS